MGQLIKIQDYISRYEQDIYKYPSRFVRLKKQQWEQLKFYWDTGWALVPDEELYETNEDESTLLNKVKRLFKRQKQDQDSSVDDMERSNEAEEPTIVSDIINLHKPANIHELKIQFLNKIFEYQMMWASTTILEKSIVDPKYYKDEYIKFLIQRFPDTFLIMFQPVFLIKKAPVETDHIMITPTGIICLTFLEDEDEAVFIGSDDRFWTKRYKSKDKKMVNPVISLNRTGKIVEQLLKLHEVDIPIEKIVLSRNGYIDYPHLSYHLKIIDKRKYEDWFHVQRTLKSPLKHLQLKAAQVLLQYCETRANKRFE